jgi:hypothetical protein
MISRMRFLIPILLAALSASPLRAADLASIERKIAKEPAYAAKPKYCLLVLGFDAKTRIWLALDGDKLHVDRNANGDLTDDGPPISAKIDGEGDTASRSFTLSELRDGSRLHKNLVLGVYSLKHFAQNAVHKDYFAKHPDEQLYGLTLDVDCPGKTGNGIGGRVEHLVSIMDATGYLRFTTTAADAPIVHFGGPLNVTLWSKENLMVGRQSDVVLGVGTPGVGSGTTAYCAYEKFIPDGRNPTVEITYPPKSPGDEPLKELYELKERC